MAVILDRYLTNCAKWKPSDSGVTRDFADGGEISRYAAPAIENMQRFEVMEGVENADGSRSILAKANATRAETAKMLAVMLKNSIR